MMEKVDRSGQEEFIWAMRMKLVTVTVDDDMQSWKDRVPSKISIDSSESSKLVESSADAQTKRLAALVPDEVIYDSTNYNIRNYEACVLFGYISGFDTLSEIYNDRRTGGPSQFTQILNSYLGSMIQEILLFNGDVINLTGDSLLAMWKTDNNRGMPDCAHQAIDCALSIQKSAGLFETDIDVVLKVKIVIIPGEVEFSLLGDECMSSYGLYGDPIRDIHEMLGNIQGGEIAVTRSTSDYINIHEYIYETLEANDFTKILGAGPRWRSSQRAYTRDDTSETNLSDTISKANINGDFEIGDVLDPRPAIAKAVKYNLKESLRKFVPVSVMHCIEMDEPLDYLTEMRNIVVSYIDVDVDLETCTSYLKTVDVCLKKIFWIVCGLDGCINQVTLFDKNALFVVIYGFRGFKHDMASTRGLFGALKCYNALSTVEHVITVTIAVTTGITYCGAIGHSLRSEYKVMSVGVNNAFKFIDAYPSKITCDRNTFLQSKLEPINFILQDNPLGIHTGPIYEFVAVTKESLPKSPISLYPILNRDMEVLTFQKLLTDCLNKEKKLKKGKKIDNQTPVALVVYGKPMEGKTRLVEEYLYCTPGDIPIFRFTLIRTDKLIPYQAIYFLFCMPMGIQENSTVDDRELKLAAKLKHIESPQLICMLNVVFKVNFPKSTVYNSLTEKQKFYALNKIIKYLCRACFTMLWVVIIDGGENMDDESWSVIKTVIDTDRILLIMTITTSSILSPIADLVLKSPRIKTLFLSPIDKWFHVGLACQFLNVRGVPAELEKVLHSHSNGNPGWIESYLMTLVHAGSLEITSIPLRLLNGYGLVVPPSGMILRPVDDARRGSHVNLTKQNISELFFSLVDKWKIFQYGFKDSTTNISTARGTNDDLDSDRSLMTMDDEEDVSIKIKSEPKLNRSKTTEVVMVDICTITLGANILDGIESESSLNASIIKILDYLTSYEQLLLKCSSVIGETLSRDMLHYLMNKDDTRKCALAVKRLFEIGVLGCAQGKFNYGGSNAILNPPVISDSNEVECLCEGLQIPDNCMDLPKYALCGYLYFKIVFFREMTYKLLTLYQRKEFHQRAIRYLEKKTRRCIKCGGGFFTKMIRQQYDEIGEDYRKRQATLSSMSQSFNYKKLTSRKSVYEVSSAMTFKSGKESQWSAITDVMLLRPGGVRVNQEIRSFGSNDFSSCECIRIQFTMYKQLVEHCEAIGLMEKWLTSNLEYGNLCIATYNMPLALKVLNKALVLFEENYPAVVRAGESWKIPLIRARIMTLIGKARLELGQVKSSFVVFDEALKNFSYTFPTRSSIKYMLTGVQQYLFLAFNKRCGMHRKLGYAAEFCDNVAHCLNLLCSLFLDLELYDQAEVAAKCSLKKALQSEKDFIILVTAYTNMMAVYMIKKEQKLVQLLETKALLCCRRYTATVELKDLETVAHLYANIFKARVLRSEFNGAINIANLLIKICGSLNRTETFGMYPLLIQILLLLNRGYDAVIILSMAEESSYNELDTYDTTWYYALCVCFHLDTGYSVIPFVDCERYRFYNTQSTLPRDSLPQKRFFVVMWLWLIRNGRMEEAESWELRINKTWSIGAYEDILNLFTALYYLEGLILSVIHKMDRMNNNEMSEHFAEINSIIDILHYHALTAKVIEPRLYHLKAFYLLAVQRDHEAFALLNKARKLAVNIGSVYDEQWIIHSEMAWKQDMTEIDYNFWKDHAVTDLISYNLLENNDKFGFFTLEPPLFS